MGDGLSFHQMKRVKVLRIRGDFAMMTIELFTSSSHRCVNVHVAVFA